MVIEVKPPGYTVYAHISPSGKMYVGITSKKPKYRWNSGYGYHKNPYFWKAIQKYGWDNFQHVIVASGLTKEEAGNMERILIDKLNLMDHDYGYNLSIGGEGALDGRCQSAESIEKMKRGVREYYKTHRGPTVGKIWTDAEKQRVSDGVRNAFSEGKMRHRDPNRGSGNGNSRRVLCVDTGVEYASGIEAAEATGIDKHHIWANARGTRKDAGGMQWVYLEECKRPQRKMPESFRENKRGSRNGRARPLMCIETNEVFATSKDLASKVGVRRSSVANAMRRNGKLKGLHYKFIDKGDKSYGT